eukprot:315697-Pelagomonas_calceolata.AAC.1
MASSCEPEPSLLVCARAHVVGIFNSFKMPQHRLLHQISMMGHSKANTYVLTTLNLSSTSSNNDDAEYIRQG